MSDEGTMLLNMPLDDAKQLRNRYGDEKYGPALRNADWLGQAYIEAVDIDNYLDIAERTAAIDLKHIQHIRNATSVLLGRMLDAHAARKAPR